MDHSLLNMICRIMLKQIKRKESENLFYFCFYLISTYKTAMCKLYFITYFCCSHPLLFNLYHTCIFLLTLNILDISLSLLKCSSHFQLKSNSTYQLTNYIDSQSLVYQFILCSDYPPVLIMETWYMHGIPHGKMSGETAVHEIQIDCSPQY